MPQTGTRPTPRKRTRKRKRRVASSSSSSPSSSDSESSDPSSQPTKPTNHVQPVSQLPEPSSSESSIESSDTDSESHPGNPLVSTATSQPENKPQPPRFMSLSPSPPPADIPPFLASTNSEAKGSQEQQLKEKFRKFWMSSVADGFKDDLEEIRKEHNLGTSRLSLLIDALASGADVFSSSSRSGGTNINEMEVVLEQNDIES